MKRKILKAEENKLQWKELEDVSHPFFDIDFVLVTSVFLYMKVVQTENHDFFWHSLLLCLCLQA